MSETAHLVTAEHEQQERARLLELVTVTKHGVAVCEHPVTDASMQVAAVLINDGGVERVPFQTDSSELRLGIPDSRPIRIGFFIGYAGSHTVSSVVRRGKYPGEPLITACGQNRYEELFITMGGPKKAEHDEKQLAAEIGLFDDLDFDPKRTKGILLSAHQSVAGSGKWETRPLIAVAESPENPGGSSPVAEQDVYQVLGYHTETAMPLPVVTVRSDFSGYDHTVESRGVRSRSGNRNAKVDRVRRTPSSSRSVPTRGTPREFGGDLTSILGPGKQAVNRLGNTSILGLQGAFEINVVRQQPQPS